MIIRPAHSPDFNSIWAIISPIVSIQETYPIDRNISKTKALAWWTVSNREVFVAAPNTSIGAVTSLFRKPFFTLLMVADKIWHGRC